MTVKELLNSTEHRPWSIPAKAWGFYQEWNKVVFLHWEVSLEELQELIPSELELDLFEGKPWVSLVPFTMENIRPKNLPSFKPISTFDEINIRTYVKLENKPGVYFLSIEAGNRLSCIIARQMSQLPYRFSKMSRSDTSFVSTNSQFGDEFNIDFKFNEDQLEKTALDRWLTERYALYQGSSNGINKFEIQHVEWPIKSLEVKEFKYDYSRFGRLLSGVPHKIHYSPGVQVIAWGKEQVISV